MLPGVGPVLARRIVENRSRLGPFESVDAWPGSTGLARRRSSGFRQLGYVDGTSPAGRADDAATCRRWTRTARGSRRSRLRSAWKARLRCPDSVDVTWLRRILQPPAEPLDSAMSRSPTPESRSAHRMICRQHQFHLNQPFPTGGRSAQAIDAADEGIRCRSLSAGVAGSDGDRQDFTMANVIANFGRPALVLSHNKTLAAQLYSEFREFFPENAVHYFVSYYDYYQPEAYIPQRDVYIEKDASINEEIDRLRLATTSSLVSRRDVVIVASVSSIYGLGSPDDYKELIVALAQR